MDSKTIHLCFDVFHESLNVKKKSIVEISVFTFGGNT